MLAVVAIGLAVKVAMKSDRNAGQDDMDGDNFARPLPNHPFKVMISTCGKTIEVHCSYNIMCWRNSYTQIISISGGWKRSRGYGKIGLSLETSVKLSYTAMCQV